MLPVTVVTGARQVGKSTLLRQEFADYAYRTLDDFTVLHAGDQVTWLHSKVLALPWHLIDQ